MTKKTPLIKYFRVNEFALSNLIETTLWFSRFDDFNDSFEGRFRIEKKYPDIFKTYEDSEHFYSLLYEHLVKEGLSAKNIEWLNGNDNLKSKLEHLFSA